VKRWETANLAEIEAIPSTGSLQWTPVRRHFGIEAFGINAFIAAEAGQDVVEQHHEKVREHEEAYVVLSGAATFTLDGDEIEARAGTIVFIRDPAVERSAVAKEPGTTVLAIGGKPGKAYEPGPWENIYAARPAGEAGNYDKAIAELEQGLELHPNHRMLLYRLACWEALAGRKDDAIEHLAQAIAQNDSIREWAHAEDAFASIRDDSRFPSASATEDD
jgi:tetratricopeptide (TPR) repeat protein